MGMVLRYVMEIAMMMISFSLRLTMMVTDRQMRGIVMIPIQTAGWLSLDDSNRCLTDVDSDVWETHPNENVEIGRDCDDSDSNVLWKCTYRRASACMKDDDNDGYGDSFVGAGIQPGSDCLDSDPYTHRAAAEFESSIACMRDFDEDGWGDPVAPVGGVAGTDCDDSDSSLEHDDKDNDGITTCQSDCDDENSGIFPASSN